MTAGTGSTTALIPATDLWGHPRERGEHFSLGTSPLSRVGPSPRARGAHEPHPDRGEQGGTIPASAGSTVRSDRGLHHKGDHPRERGEHPLICAFRWNRVGPSPRVRGALRHSGRDAAGRRTIPASAGSTALGRRRRRIRWDHPRERGEHPSTAAATAVVSGPSPRARGARVPDVERAGAAGTIPASAGSTAAATRAARIAWDHPRERGEHQHLEIRSVAEWGPSPRARGALLVATGAAVHGGTIPASAGSTSPRPRTPHAGWDHPRERGEHCRVQGGVLLGDGTIPASAGSTCHRSGAAAAGRDHPRERGEHSGSNPRRMSLMGPSPRARGALDPPVRAEAGRGTIPASAGSTASAPPFG